MTATLKETTRNARAQAVAIAASTEAGNYEGTLRGLARFAGSVADSLTLLSAAVAPVIGPSLEERIAQLEEAIKPLEGLTVTSSASLAEGILRVIIRKATLFDLELGLVAAAGLRFTDEEREYLRRLIATVAADDAEAAEEDLNG